MPLEEIKDEATSPRDDDIYVSDRDGAAAASQFASARPSCWQVGDAGDSREASHDARLRCYLRFHEISREKNDKGEPQYEATVFIGWNEKTKQYACVWLDVYGGATSESIGLATPKEDELAFVFTDEHGNTSFTNTFTYNPKTKAWENRLDNVVKGEAKPFARFNLTKQ